ncbi:hypothetical protein [Desertivirga xinjiangensis]|uniref:hypothetical protein n=1 Tax=Desertivirga xinjiangensis TaxID=539206 RepID=UPI00210D47F6|nr:hypothetical protein [Pedobacter xinjiangensis]
MNGINKARHVNLVNALHQLESIAALLESNSVVSCVKDESQSLMFMPTSLELREKRLELEHSLEVYFNMLDDLANHISVYEDLFSNLKVSCVSAHLKALKKNIQPQDAIVSKLKTSISLAYCT